MDPSNLPTHWRFAAHQGFVALTDLIERFDFRRLADGHTYVDVSPAFLLEVIDGFLGEGERVLYGGDRARLQDQRRVVVDRIAPAYARGVEAGGRPWQDGSATYGSLSVEALHALAFRMAPDDPAARNWFVEGFCYTYAYAELESLRLKPRS